MPEILGEGCGGLDGASVWRVGRTAEDRLMYGRSIKETDKRKKKMTRWGFHIYQPVSLVSTSTQTVPVRGLHWRSVRSPGDRGTLGLWPLVVERVAPRTMHDVAHRWQHTLPPANSLSPACCSSNSPATPQNVYRSKYFRYFKDRLFGVYNYN